MVYSIGRPSRQAAGMAFALRAKEFSPRQRCAIELKSWNGCSLS
jgi:hypothetical protein